VKVDVARLMELTTESKPEAATHWSIRTTRMIATGVSAASISRHWRAKGLKPRFVHGFKVSRDPKFAEKLEAVAGLYLASNHSSGSPALVHPARGYSRQQPFKFQTECYTIQV
jgi:hypothetical protein